VEEGISSLHHHNTLEGELNMGRGAFSRAAFDDTVRTHTRAGASASARGEERVRSTGKLDPLVDPAEYGVVRPSRIRLEDRPDGLFQVAVGSPVSIEYRLDTTGSMGDNVDRALAALPNICGLTSQVVPERDPFYCASIFGDLADTFPDGSPGYPLNRGQFEVLADRMVNQLTLMNPMRNGCGNRGEDPHYGFFGGAYLTNAYLNRIGLKRYDFTISDEPVHEGLSAAHLKRIYGSEVFEHARENGHKLNERDLPSNTELVRDLQKQAHAFGLLVNGHRIASHWQEMFGKDHVVHLPEIEFLPHVMATIIGLTEGTLDLRSAVDFLTQNEVSKSDARSVVDAVAHIPLGAQCALPNYKKQPVKGDVFRTKTDLWPMKPGDVPIAEAPSESTATQDGGWL
jgi:hypothetical protein